MASKKWLGMVLSVSGVALPWAAHADIHQCACVHNYTGREVAFKTWFKDENGVIRNRRLDINKMTAVCWNEGLFGGPRSEVFVELDSLLVAPGAKSTYELRTGDSPPGSCQGTPSSNHYGLRLDPAQPGYVILTSDAGGNNAPATPAPYPAPAYPQSAYPQPAPAYAPPPSAYPAPYPAPAYAPPPAYPAPAYTPPPPAYPAPAYAPPPSYPAPGGFVPATPATGTNTGATRPPLF